MAITDKKHPKLAPHTAKLRKRLMNLKEIQGFADRVVADEIGLTDEKIRLFLNGQQGMIYEHGKLLEGWLDDQD